MDPIVSGALKCRVRPAANDDSTRRGASDNHSVTVHGDAAVRIRIETISGSSSGVHEMPRQVGRQNVPAHDFRMPGSRGRRCAFGVAQGFSIEPTRQLNCMNFRAFLGNLAYLGVFRASACA
jgi:hypothetical protein